MCTHTAFVLLSHRYLTRQWLFSSADIGKEIIFAHQFKDNSNICKCVHMWIKCQILADMFIFWGWHHISPPTETHCTISCWLRGNISETLKWRLFRSQLHFKEDSVSVPSTFSNCHFNLKTGVIIFITFRYQRFRYYFLHILAVHWHKMAKDRVRLSKVTFCIVCVNSLKFSFLSLY